MSPVIPASAGGQLGRKETDMDLDPIPEDVKYEILELANSVPLLKTCRLVSKSWNKISCRTMQKLAAVPLKGSAGDEDSLEELKDIVLDRQAYFPPDWPNPFRNYKVLQACFSNLNFVRFIQRPNLRVTTLDITHDENFDPVSFEKILEKHRGWITHIQIRSKVESPGPFLALGEELGKGWPSLQKVSLSDACGAGIVPCPHTEFIIALTASNKVQHLRLEGHLRNITSVLARNRESWDQLVQLNLKSDQPPANATPEEISGFMEWAQEIKFPSLTELVVWFSCDGRLQNKTSEKYTPYTLPLIQESSQALKSLAVTFMPLALLPSCPNISHLTCAFADGDRIHDVTELKFPSLTSLHCVMYWKEAPVRADPTDSRVHRKLVYVTVSRGEPGARATLETLWPSFRDHFPNLNSLWIQPAVTLGTLLAVRRCLPKLQDLAIKNISTNELLGTTCGTLLASKGWASQDILNCPLFEMSELIHLRLGESTKLTREAINVLLGKLRKLKYLSFYWNNSLEVADVQEHLGHVPKVNIFFQDKEQRQKLEKLSKTMKSINLSKHEEPTQTLYSRV